MKNYSQNNEQEFILKFFHGKQGSLLDIGANNGIDNSNSRALLESGWVGVLVEPNRVAFDQIPVDERITALRYAVTDYDGVIQFNITDDSQLGTTKRQWRYYHENEGRNFESIEVGCISVATLLKKVSAYFDFITIDAEGCDFEILKQFPEDFCGAKMISIECSGEERGEIKKYLEEKGFSMYHSTHENLIMTK